MRGLHGWHFLKAKSLRYSKWVPFLGIQLSFRTQKWISAYQTFIKKCWDFLWFPFQPKWWYFCRPFDVKILYGWIRNKWMVILPNNTNEFTNRWLCTTCLVIEVKPVIFAWKATSPIKRNICNVRKTLQRKYGISLDEVLICIDVNAPMCTFHGGYKIIRFIFASYVVECFKFKLIIKL